MQAKIKELSGFHKTLTEWGIQKKLAELKDNASTTDPFYDVLVFNKFKDILGGNIRKLVTGSAPISRDILDFLKIAFCCPIMEGYGQTESAGAVTISQSIDPESGHVGASFPAVEIKLIDVLDMDYTTNDVDEKGQSRPRGEICYRGNSVFKGYYRQPDLMKEVVDSDGWVHSGDIAQLDPVKGVFRIIDRKKNIFKLS
jgi:long-chain acyl-CoA synthetase